MRPTRWRGSSRTRTPAGCGEPADPDADAAAVWLRGSAPGVVEWDGWSAIDAHERGLGEPHGRPRVKLVRTDELVAASRSVAR